MAKRQSIITYDSTLVQGEGSFIKVRLITHGESKDILRNYGAFIGVGADQIPADKLQEMQAANEDKITRNVVDWNWVNDDDEPLPLPKDDPAVLDLLTEAEHQFIGAAMRGEGERKK